MKGLNKLYYIKIDIKNLKAEIEEIKEEIEGINRDIASLQTVSSPQLSGMPHGSGVSNPVEKYYLKKEALEDKKRQRYKMLEDKLLKLEDKLLKCEAEKVRLEGIIERIDVSAIQTMARMRFIENKSWEEIGYATSYDRSVCYRKLKKYIENMDI